MSVWWMNRYGNNVWCKYFIWEMSLREILNVFYMKYIVGLCFPFQPFILFLMMIIITIVTWDKGKKVLMGNDMIHMRREHNSLWFISYYKFWKILWITYYTLFIMLRICNYINQYRILLVECLYEFMIMRWLD